MDEDTFGRWRDCFVNATVISLNGVLLCFSLRLDLIERPLLVRVLTGNLLHGSCQEALRIVEAGQPEGSGALSSIQPTVQLEVSVDETLNPTTKRGSEP